MTLDQVTQEGFYFARMDEHRPWHVIHVTRQASNPKHPRYNSFEYGQSGRGCAINTNVGYNPIVVGPIPQPVDMG